MRSLFGDSEIFAHGEGDSPAVAPLAERLRPKTLDQVLGQERILGEGGFIRRCLQAGSLPSLILWGPPGSGKTTIARILASESGYQWVPFSAVTSGIKEVKAVMKDAAKWFRAGRKTLLFVDEIHRFNRAQQDAFLPYVESGEIVLVGATTENPSFKINAALVSRCRIVVLDSLPDEHLETLLQQGIMDAKLGLGDKGLELTKKAAEAIVRFAEGDARRALNILEASAIGLRSGSTLNQALVEKAAQRRILLYDASGEEHYNLISALHKSIREGDPDAALYWLARMIEGGEDPNYIARRLNRIAAEDVGLADPASLNLTLSAWNSFERLGSPEGELALAEVVIYLALAPKSDAAYRAWNSALEVVRTRRSEPVPTALRNAPTRLMKDLGYGKGYQSAHHSGEGVTGMECLPQALREEVFYSPGDEGLEAKLKNRLESWKKKREAVKSKKPSENSPQGSPETGE